MKVNQKTPRIYSTTDYDLFVNNSLQRTFRQHHVDDLAKSMGKNGFVTSGLISVSQLPNGKLQLNTGHHRVPAAQQAGVPVLFIIEHAWTAQELIDEGVSGKRWSGTSVVVTYAKKGDKNYIELLSYVERGIPLSMAASLLIGESAGSGNACRVINSGKFKIKTREHADIIVEMIVQFSDRIPATKSRLFISVLSKCLFTPEFDRNQLIRRLEACPTMLEKTSNEQQMLKQVEDIYNFKSQKKIPLAFIVTNNSNSRHVTFGKGAA